MNRTLLISALVLAVNAYLWPADWFAAPGKASGKISDIESVQFISLEGIESLEALLTAEEGWYWLKSELPFDAQYLLLDFGPIVWEAWLTGTKTDTKIGSSGKGPPYWQPVAALPRFISLSDWKNGEKVLALKIFIRRGHGEKPPFPFTGNLREIRQKWLSRMIMYPGVILLTLILGLILFIGGITARYRTAALFGLAMTVRTLLPLLGFIDGLSIFIPWHAITIMSIILMPVTVSLWRKSITTTIGLKLPLFDGLLVCLIAGWNTSAYLNLDIPQRLENLYYINPLPYYTILSLILIFIVLLADLVKKKKTMQPVLLLSSALMPSAIALLNGASFFELYKIFIQYGLSASLFLAVIILFNRRGSVNFADLDMEPEWQETKESPDKQSTSPDSTKSSSLALYPIVLSMDAYWTIAGVQQKFSHSGFYDVYSEGNRSVHGFSFIEGEKRSIDSMAWAHTLKNTLIQHSTKGESLSNIARMAHDEIFFSEKQSHERHNISGVLGSLSSDRIRILPLGMPPMLLKKGETGKVISLLSLENRIANPALSAEGLNNTGFKTISIPVKRGDTILVFNQNFAPSATEEKPEILKMYQTLSRLEVKEAADCAWELIRGLQDSSNLNIAETIVQILVIHRC